MKLLKMLLLIALLAFAAFACGGNEPGVTDEETPGEVADSADNVDNATDPQPPNTPEPAAEPTTAPEPTDEPEPTNEPEPTEEPTAEVDDEPLMVSDISSDYSEYNSYALAINMTVTDGDTGETSQTIEMFVQISNDPPMQQISMSAQGVDDTMGDELMVIEMATIDGQTFMVVPEMGCISLPSGGLEDTPFGSMLEADELLEDLQSAERVFPNETINGVETKHYVFDENYFAEIEEGDIVQGDLYVEVGTNRLVRLVMNGEGAGIAASFTGEESAETDTPDLFNLVYDVTAVNEPFEVTIPEGCAAEAAGEGNDYPMLDDAYEQSTFGAMVNYKTPTALADVVTFYQDSFADLGWTYSEDESFVTDAVATLIFTMDGANLTVLIAPDPTGDDTTVTIMDQ